MAALKPPATSDDYTVLQRKRLAEAVLQGFCDGALISSAQGNTLTGWVGKAQAAGYIPGGLSDIGLQNTPIGGNNT